MRGLLILKLLLRQLSFGPHWILRRSLQTQNEGKPSSDFPDPTTNKKAHQRLISDGLFYFVKQLLNGSGRREMLTRLWIACWAEWQRNLPLGFVIVDNPKQAVEMLHCRVAIRALLMFLLSL
jgi:hypothetical protein